MQQCPIRSNLQFVLCLQRRLGYTLIARVVQIRRPKAKSSYSPLFFFTFWTKLPNLVCIYGPQCKNLYTNAQAQHVVHHVTLYINNLCSLHVYVVHSYAWASYITYNCCELCICTNTTLSPPTDLLILRLLGLYRLCTKFWDFYLQTGKCMCFLLFLLWYYQFGVHFYCVLEQSRKCFVFAGGSLPLKPC